ncbi:MAG: hypothetical protein MUC92_08710 [Fimbriimonadaceae bacterium]|jgi:hypothetical protein|nr:hypothetical protein [Fimbriimonadaceae bacterium]
MNSRHFLSLLSLSLLAALAHSQDLGVKVTYSTSGKTLPQLAAELSKATGVDIRVMGDSRLDVVAVRATDVTLVDLLRQVTNVTGNGLFSQGQSVVIQRDGQLDRNFKQSEDQLVLTRLRSSISKVSAQLSEAPRPPANAGPGGGGGMMALFNSGNIALGKTLPLLPAESLASMAVGQRLVFSGNRTAMQAQLPNQAVAIAEEAYRTQVERLNNSEAQAGPIPITPEVLAQLKGSRPHRIYVVVTRQSDTSFQVEYQILTNVSLAPPQQPGNQGQGGQRGQGVAQMMGGVQTFPLVFGITQINLEPEAEKAPSVPFSGQDGDIELSPLALELFRRVGSAPGQMRVMGFGMPGGGPMSFASMNGNPAASQPPTFKLDDLRDVLKNEPLSFTVGALMDLLNPGNYVANLPDRSFQTIGNLMVSDQAQNKTKARVWNDLQTSGDLKVSTQNGWTTWTPNKMIATRNDRTDREALQTLIIEMKALGAASLNALASYAVKAPVNRAPDLLDSFLLGLIYGPGAQRQISDVSLNREAYLIYSKIESGMRQSMIQSGQPVALNQVSAIAQDAGRLVFFGQGGPSRVAAEERRRGGPQGGPPGMIANLFGTERTELFPQGVPQNAMVRLTSNSDQVVRLSQQASGWAQTMRPEEIAWSRAASESFGQFRGMMGPDLNSFDQFMMVNQETVLITIMLTPEWQVVRPISGVSIVPGASAGRFEQLPEEIQRRYRENYARAQETFARGGQGGGMRRGPRNAQP